MPYSLPSHDIHVSFDFFLPIRHFSFSSHPSTYFYPDFSIVDFSSFSVFFFECFNQFNCVFSFFVFDCLYTCPILSSIPILSLYLRNFDPASPFHALSLSLPLFSIHFSLSATTCMCIFNCLEILMMM